MPYELALPARLRRLWKVKVQDREALYEEPHVTIWRRTRRWRWSLRRRVFLDPVPDPAEVSPDLLALMAERYGELCREWNRRFPANPVREPDDEGETP